MPRESRSWWNRLFAGLRGTRRRQPFSRSRTLPRFETLENRLAPANETFSASQATILQADLDADGVIDPGETVTTTVTITNNSTNTDATGVQFTETLDGMTLFDQPGRDDINVSPLAFDDLYNVVGNTTFSVSAASVILANDVEFFSHTIGANPATQTHLETTGVIDTAGGSVTLNADGSFTYTPDLGFTGTDSFTYTLRDVGLDGVAGNADDLTGTGTATFNVEDLVWFIDNTAPGSTNVGTQANPFTSIAAFNAVNDGVGANHPAANHVIYLREGTYTEADGINLLNSQVLIGQGENLVVNHSVGGNITVETGSAGQTPVLVVTGAANQGIQLAQNNTISGLDVGMNNATAVGIADGGGSVGTVIISNVGVGVSQNLGQAIDIDQGGTLNVQLDSVTSSGAAVGIDLGSATGLAGTGNHFTVSGATTINDATADGIAIANSSVIATFTGEVTILNDAASANGDGVDLLTNTGTYNFNGGVDITVIGTNAFGFRAQGSGTVNILDPGGANQITSNNGTALFINPTAFQATLNSVTAGDGGSGDGIHLEGVTGTGVTIATVSLNGMAGDGIDITSSSANITINGGSIGNTNDPAGIGVDVNGGTGNVTISATINKTSTGNVVQVSARTGGTVDFIGNITANAAGSGIDLTSNTGGTIRFDGGMALSTSTSAAFNSSGGSTVATLVVTDPAGATNNTLTTSTGTALNVANTTIGAEDLTFQSISASGASNGIVLDNTGSSGGLHVTGDGVNTTLGGNGSGGTIQNTTGAGIRLNNTADVSLNYVNITSPGTDAIAVTNINGFTLNRSTLSDSAGTAPFDATIDFNNYSTGDPSITPTGVNGTINITHSLIGPASGSSPHNTVTAVVGSGTSTWNVTGTTIRNTGNSGINLEVRNSSVITAFTVSGSTFAGANVAGGSGSPSARGIFANNLEDSVIGLMKIENNTFTNNNIHIDLNQQNDTDPVGSHTFVVRNNTMTGSRSHAMNIFAAAGSFGGEFTGTINNNTIGNASIDGSGSEIGNGIRVNMNGGTDATMLIHDNDIVETPNGRGIEVIGRNGLGTLDITITDNLVDHYNLTFPIGGGAAAFPLGAIYVNAAKGGGSGIIGFTVQADVRGNTVPTAGGALPAASEVTGTYLALVESVGSETGGILELVDSPAGPGGQTPTQQLQSTNTGDAGANAGVSLIAGPIDVPPIVPLLAAPGGVETADREASDSGDTAPPVVTDNNPSATGSEPAVSGNELPAEHPGSGMDVPAHPVIVNDDVLSQSELEYFVDAAITRWIGTGLSADQVAALHALDFTVGSMSGMYLGSYQPGLITLDSDAAERGWYLDPTPLDDAEFGNVFAVTRMQTDPAAAPAGHFDLLTTVMHEMGHALGLEDYYETAARDNLMFGWLFAGERRLPGAGEADDAVLGSITTEEFAGSVIEVLPADATGGLFTLPFGKTVTIQWQATIDAQNNQLIVNPQNTGTVSATNAVGFDDTDTNTVTTTLDTLTLGGTVWNDNGAGGGSAGNGLKDGGEPGIPLVALTLFADTGASPGIWDAGDTQVTTATSGVGGDYSIPGLAPGEYIVRVDQSNFDAGGALLATQVSPITSLEPPDPDNNTDNDDNGARVAGQPAFSLAITLDYNTEPTAGTGNDTNNTLDFGFLSNQPPTANNVGPFTGDEDQAARVEITLSGTDPDAGDAVDSFTIDTLPANGSLFAAAAGGIALTAGAIVPATGSGPYTALVYFQPNADFNGATSFTYSAFDGVQQSAAATASITVNAVVDIAGDTATTDEDTPVNVLVLDNDTFEGTPAITGTTSGANGTVGVNDNGTPGNTADDFVVYTPNADFNGADTFSYTVTSGGVTETANVDVTI
ncbi:MAG: Ig-like domain-containing protein, partial [Gemmataceae bacterium]|nr:Ig-like domain-containing protein [Gemmataceae bacterium]